MTEPGPGTSSSGSLRTKISLKSGTVVTPFHTFKTSLPPYSEIQGNHDLLTSYGLGPVANGFTGVRRVKEKIDAFLPHIIGEFNFDATKDASSLKALIEKPPIHKDIMNLLPSAMQGFKLSSGLVDERYRHFFKDRKDEGGPIFFDEKLQIVRVKPAYDAYGLGEDETERQFPLKKEKEKKKKKKKDKKRKKDKDSSDGSEKKKKKKHHDDPSAPAPMEF